MRESYHHEPVQPAYKDSRSAAVGGGRWKKDQDKYLGHRTTHPGQVGLEHYYQERNPFSYMTVWPADLDECPRMTMSKRKLFAEAQRDRPYWLPPRHHRACGEKKYKYSKREADRQERAAGREARDWNINGSHASFKSTEQDNLAYLYGADEAAKFWLELCWYFDSLETPAPQPLRQAIDFDTLIDNALEKRNRRRRVGMQKLGWVDAAAEFDPLFEEDEWVDAVIDHVEVDPLSEFELL